MKNRKFQQDRKTSEVECPIGTLHSGSYRAAKAQRLRRKSGSPIIIFAVFDYGYRSKYLDVNMDI